MPGRCGVQVLNFSRSRERACSVRRRGACGPVSLSEGLARRARWALLRGYYQHFKYRNIMTEDVVEYFNRKTGMNLTPVFDQYLRHTALPALELTFDDAKGTVSYRWKADEPGFAMPVRVGTKDHWRIIRPTTAWQTMKTPSGRDQSKEG